MRFDVTIKSAGAISYDQRGRKWFFPQINLLKIIQEDLAEISFII
jgi:hypothetical protein